MRIRWCTFRQLLSTYYRVCSSKSYPFFARFETNFRRFRHNFGSPRFLLALSAGFSFKDHGFNESHVEQIQSTAFGTKDEEVSKEDGWEPLVIEENLRVHRRKIDGHQNLYEYRCAGSYYDISPENFLEAQNDIEYRRKWDGNVISLEVLASDQQTDSKVIRWIAKFPFPMYAREYVYVRRQYSDEHKKTILVISKSVGTDEFPVSGNYVRVLVYASTMIIRAHTDYNKDGLDYVLTYCDNPEASIPTTAYNWIVNHGGPYFLKQVYAAAKALEASKLPHRSRDTHSVISNNVESPNIA
uniref:Phosphatidylcholine transfer protein n=1 Tax=Steinernema glaseri TaxID=37863 RepID=A0A1I8A1P1_9BILA